MELSETAINILMGALIFVLLLVNIYMRKRKNDEAPIGRAAGIFIDIDKNLKRMESFSFHWQTGKLNSKNWERNKNRIDFLPEEIRAGLANAFDMVEDINQRIESGRKYKSDSYMAGIDVSKLKMPLEKSKTQLQEWVQENMQNPEYQPKRRRGLFG
ncbi:hypothetical protein ACFLXH_03800 [Chloroflexota bacterium]